MSFETLNCNECGALLQVPSVARYVTCNRCGAHLVVQRAGITTYTESARQPAPDSPDPTWREMADRLDYLEHEGELARVEEYLEHFPELAGNRALLLDLDQGAELVNFGACLGFMAVNLSVLGHYFVRLRQRGGSRMWANVICPAIGFAICFLIWLSISPLAMRVGALWTVAGLVYLGVQTGGFRRKLS